MDNSLWSTLILALLSSNIGFNDNRLNYLGKYTKYYKYGSDE